MSKGRLWSLLTTAIVAGLGAVLLLNLQYVRDVASYYQYQPSAEIAAIAEAAGMNEKGKFLFYASHPSIEEAENFNRYCSKQESTTAILGCYNGFNIYIYNVQEPRLDGIKQTTAAHEMLHAAYTRLNTEKKRRVDELLLAEFEKLQNNESLMERMAFYERTQPGEQTNELHSIIGTEVADIGNELEEYYKLYFTDRQKVVRLHSKYSSVFVDLRMRADALSSQIDMLAQDIENNQKIYTVRATRLQSQISDFNRRATLGEFESQAAFYNERNVLVAESNELENLRLQISDAINEYNRLIEEFNAIATETRELNRSLDSNLEPVPIL